MWPLQGSCGLPGPNSGGLSRPLPKKLSSERKEEQVKDKGHGGHAIVPMYSVVILSRWDSISTFKLYKNRKGLRFTPVILCKESILSNPLPLSQGPLPSCILEMLIPRAKRNKLDPTTCQAWIFLAFEPKYQAENGKEVPSLFISTISLYLSLWKTTESLCVRMYVFFIYIYAYVCIMHVILVATGNLLWKCNFYLEKETRKTCLVPQCSS